MVNLKQLAKFSSAKGGLPVTSNLMWLPGDRLLSAKEVTDLLGDELGNELLDLVTTDLEYIALAFPENATEKPDERFKPAHEVIIAQLKQFEDFEVIVVSPGGILNMIATDAKRAFLNNCVTALLNVLREMFIPPAKLPWVVKELKGLAFDDDHDLLESTIAALEARQAAAASQTA